MQRLFLELLDFLLGWISIFRVIFIHIENSAWLLMPTMIGLNYQKSVIHFNMVEIVVYIQTCSYLLIKNPRWPPLQPSLSQDSMERL